MSSKGKKEEREWLDLLIRCLPDMPAGKIRAGESPDFVILSGPKKRSGLEMTRLTRPDQGKGVPLPGESGSSPDRFTPELTKNQLVDLIAMKEAKLRLYRKKKLHPIWLVIVVNGFDNPPSFNIRNQVENWRIRSRFDRVILLDLSQESVYEVSPPPPDS